MPIPVKLLRDRPLQQQLYKQIRELILSSRLPAGMRMPSTRLLAEQCAVSRITVLLAYERLIAEGYLRTVPARGTFVQGLGAGGQAFPPDGVGNPVSADGPIGRADGRLFPAAKWRALVRGALDHLDHVADGSDRGGPGWGEPVLRHAIARWLSSARGLAVEADQIILAHGRRHALHIAAHLLLRPGSRAVVEAPGDADAGLLLAGTGATLMAVPVDADGLQTDHLPGGPIALALVTPEHQRPLGAVMSLERRKALLIWATTAGAVVVADESAAELRYQETDVPPLMRLDRGEVVIQAGDFAASLGPAVTLGYLAVPPRLVGAARAASRVMGPYEGRLEAAALAGLLDSGCYARHLHQVRQICLRRRDALVRALRRHFGEQTRIAGLAAGLHLAWTPPPELGAADAVAAAAWRAGLDAGCVDGRVVLLGFGGGCERQLEACAEAMARALAVPRVPAAPGCGGSAAPGRLPGDLPLADGGMSL
jgi:GntR family transcriptional regulator / MocR family aminotransferase